MAVCLFISRRAESQVVMQVTEESRMNGEKYDSGVFDTSGCLWTRTVTTLGGDSRAIVLALHCGDIESITTAVRKYNMTNLELCWGIHQ